MNDADLGVLISAWNSYEPEADLNDDGVVNGGDLEILLWIWGDRRASSP